MINPSTRYINVDNDIFNTTYTMNDSENMIVVKGEDISPLDIQNWRFSFLLNNYKHDNRLSIKDITIDSDVDSSIVCKALKGSIFNEKLWKWYLEKTIKPIEDIKFILTGEVEDEI